MAELNELFTAMNMFADGAQKLAVTQGINEASQHLDQINQSEMDAMEKRQQQTQLANSLALRLTGAGAAASQVQQAVSAVAPPTIANADDMYQQAIRNGNDPKMLDVANKMQSFENKGKMDVVDKQGENAVDVANTTGAWHLKAAEAGADKKIREDKLKIAKGFNAASKDVIGQLDAIDTMGELSKLGNPVADTAIRSNFARSIGNEKGKIPIQEIMQYTGDPSLVNKISRFMNKEINGEQFTAKDRAAMTQAFATAKSQKEKQLQGLVQLHAGQAVQAGVVDDGDSATKLLAGDNPRLKTLMGIGQPAAAAASAAAASPAPGIPGGSVKKTVRDKTTMQMIQVWQSPDGKLFKAE